MAIQQISHLATTFASQAAVAPPRPAAASEPKPIEIKLPGQAPPQQPSQAQAEQAMEQAVEAVQKAVAPVARDLRFSIDKETGKTIISVVDAMTNEVIRQIPGEEILAIAKAIDRMQGLLFNREA